MSEASAPAARFDVPPAQIVRSSLGRGWHGLDAAEVVHPEDDFAVPALARHVLVFNLGTPMAATETRTGRAGRLAEGSVIILPAGSPRDWHLDRCGEVRHLHLYLDPWLLRRVAAEADLNPDAIELPEGFGVHDPELAHAGAALRRELEAEAPGGRLYADALATLLALHLLRRHAALAVVPPRGPAALPPAALKRATEFIEANLADDLSLGAVAAAASYSPYHFARLFKAATGLAPHQYIIRRRVERARALLAATDRPLAVIAHEAGFAAAGHLAHHVRRLLGVAPSALRPRRAEPAAASVWPERSAEPPER